MADQDRTSRDADELRTQWLQTLEMFGLCLLYVTAFWGQAAQWLPAPLDQWHSLLYRAAGPWWHAHVATGLIHREQAALYQLVEAVFIAVLLPIWVLHRKGYTMRNAGVSVPGRGALWPSIAGIVLSLLVGLYLSRVVSHPWRTPLEEGLGLLVVIPEHFLIFGVFGALLLPGGHVRGPGGERRMGIHEAFAIAATAAMFGLVHVGVEHPSVLIASFPLGVINAYVTVRTASIWPAVGAHWIMNVVPMTWDLLRT
jgi:membrane protease YdiL (CAAX protease family)